MKPNALLFAFLGLLMPAALIAQSEPPAAAPPPATPFVPFVPGRPVVQPAAPQDAAARGGIPTPPGKEPAGFYFPGGTPRQFLQALDKYYSVDWLSVADIPADMANVRIPSFRLRPDQPRLAADGQNAGAADGAGNDPLETLVKLYNLMGEDKPELGQLAVKGAFARPVTVTFKPSFLPATQAVGLKMKAFPLKGIPESDWEKLANTAEDDAQKLMAAQRKMTAVPGHTRTQDAWDMRQITIHSDTALMSVIGPEAMLDAVDTILAAWRVNLQAEPARTATGK